MSVAIDFQLSPHKRIERVGLDDEQRWHVLGHDGSFDCLAPGKFPFVGGWYRVEAKLVCHAGELRQPVLYPDYGFGAIEGTRVLLPSMLDGKGICIARFVTGVHSLQLHPSIAMCEFELEGLRIKKVGRARAFADMFAGVWHQAAGGAARLRLFGGAIRAALSGGPRHLGDWLYGAYVGAGKERIPDTYAQWIELYDGVSVRNAGAIAARLDALASMPLISVVMPVYNTDRHWLRACIESVRAQCYPKWELCIADDASPSPHVRAVLDEYVARDPRIRVAYREKNGHISAASNTALDMARGEFVALLDHDDELHPMALLVVAEAFQANPRWKLLFSDEDKIDAQGRRYEPYFKADFNYELILGQNCISHLGVYATNLVRELGGFQLGMEGSQDWDLALRCIERLEADEIGHVSAVLYHWRAIPGSTALSGDQKGYALDAGYKAVKAHLARVSARASVEPVHGLPGNYRVVYPLPEPQPRVSLVVPTRDRVDLLKNCVSSILAVTAYENYEILIVDNESVEAATLEYFAAIAGEHRVRIVPYSHAFNYSAMNNFAVSQTDAELIGLVNNDIEAISAGWLSEMVSHAVRPDVGCVGAMLYYPNNTVQHAGVLLGFGGVAGHGHHALPRGSLGYFGRLALTQEYSAVTAACLIVRRDVYKEVGGLDESLKVAFNDVDFCLRVRVAGYRNVWTPHAELYHHESASRGHEDTPEKMARFESEIRFMRDRWGLMLDRDPAYNVNLSLNTVPFALAFPPRDAVAQ